MFPGNRKDDDGRVLNKPPVDLSARLKSPRGVHSPHRGVHSLN